jgi:ketosteroid isomerase-like protein
MLMNKDTTPALADAVARYFDAANRFDAESAAACFAPDATVHDEGQTHLGTTAIRNWVAHTGEKYQPQTTVLQSREEGDQRTVRVRVTGQFPGSPAELEFVFVLREGKIAQLTIG